MWRRKAVDKAANGCNLQDALTSSHIVICCQLNSLPLLISDISQLVSNGTNCLNLFHPIRILASTAASASPSTLNISPTVGSRTYPLPLLAKLYIVSSHTVPCKRHFTIQFSYNFSSCFFSNGLVAEFEWGGI